MSFGSSHRDTCELERDCPLVLLEVVLMLSDEKPLWQDWRLVIEPLHGEKSERKKNAQNYKNCWHKLQSKGHNFGFANTELLKISWTDKETNVWVPNKVGTELIITKTILERKLRLFGHIIKRDGGMENQISTRCCRTAYSNIMDGLCKDSVFTWCVRCNRVGIR